MIRVHSSRSWLARATAGLCLAAFLAAPAAAAEPAGIWKLVVLAFGDEDFAIVDLHRQDGEAKGVLVDGRKGLLEGGKVLDLKLEDDRASFAVKGPAMTMKFAGGLAKNGPYAGQVLGTIQLQNNIFPAKLEKTRDEKLGAAKPNAIGQDFFKARNEQDPKAQVEKFKAILAKNAGAPVCQLAYTGILGAAGAAGLPSAEVEKLIAAWRSEAEPFGPAWAQEIAIRSFGLIAPQKTYADTALRLGQELEKSLTPEVTTENRHAIAGLLAFAARNAGKADLAADAEARAAKLDAQLDEEYQKKVPPFSFTPFEGRKKSDAGQTVVFELFTGAQCPPCVAADVAFDALLKTYKPTEFIGLQYHLHVPGPDPLTNPDSEARQKYYGDQVRGTPSTFFNGRPEAPGGGPMAASEDKYNEYRGLIDGMLEKKRTADVTVSAKRTGDEIAILAEATTPAPSDAAKADAAKPKAGDKAASTIKLRLALTEESIRYVGGNKLRFHHHVVRALPGGAEGATIVGGKGKVEIKLDLADVRKRIDEYVSDFAKQQPFHAPPPAVALKDLSVVAFVQDDLDKTILGAVSVPVAEATP
ncbi:hypothetical protein [Paludisphaera mucosa]|uniref:Thioredoxin domain-containing protein n=1 Tax=Paludisphaera mucosa TaxID=3030827 RepID=A0ABT6F769_9BACT|nr:hypothetical protein [Paludisphaera mucosa]MDG3003425.1 hypothetical protein [Paludisphaera mucosa]